MVVYDIIFLLYYTHGLRLAQVKAQSHYKAYIVYKAYPFFGTFQFALLYRRLRAIFDGLSVTTFSPDRYRFFPRPLPHFPPGVTTFSPGFVKSSNGSIFSSFVLNCYAVYFLPSFIFCKGSYKALFLPVSKNSLYLFPYVCFLLSQSSLRRSCDI